MRKTILKFLLKLLYGARIEGLHYLKNLPQRTVVVGRHVSLIDGLLIYVFFPGKPLFVVSEERSGEWWMRMALWVVGKDSYKAISPSKPLQLKEVVDAVKKGRQVVIFPEGRVTVTSGVMKIYEGTSLIIEKAKADVVLVHVSGAKHSPFSYMQGKLPIHWFPRMTLKVLGVHKHEDFIHDRSGMARMLYDLLTESEYKARKQDCTLFQKLIHAADINGLGKAVIQDQEMVSSSYRDLIAKSMIVGEIIAKEENRVGLLIPNSKAAVVSFFGLQSAGITAVMLNYSASHKAILSACKTSQLKTVWTSKKFIIVGKFQPLVDLLESSGLKVCYLEDLKTQVNKFKFIFAKLLPRTYYRLYCEAKQKAPEDEAAILFTSGSTGMPKGVVLSHRNLIANLLQMLAVVDFTQNDRMFNALPVFHAFGLTAGVLAPIMGGAFTFLYPNPLHYTYIPELIYNTNATILLGTNTFLKGYLRRANDYDLFNMRYIFAGAEKVQPDTQRAYEERFGVRIFEGYGATETSPVLSINNGIYNKKGTTGRLLPGIQYKLEKIDGITNGQKLWVKGNSVMLGYMREEKPGVLEKLPDGWYDTGDIVDIDDEGYIKIVGRAKRFAKIGGEMVSLGAVEELAAQLWPESNHACVSQSHQVRGEELVLFTEETGANRKDLLEFARSRGINELSVPKNIRVIDSLPVLGSGKPNYMALQKELED